MLGFDGAVELVLPMRCPAETPEKLKQDESVQNVIGMNPCIQYVGSQAGRCRSMQPS